MSYSNTGSGQPKIFQATKSTRQAPGGVRLTNNLSLYDLFYTISTCVQVQSRVGIAGNFSNRLITI